MPTPTYPTIPADGTQPQKKNVELLTLAVFGFQQLIAQAPHLWNEFAALFQKKDPPSEAEWTALRDRIGSKTYHDFVPQSDLPKPTP